ncbi:MAG: hypothetical protein CML04_07235 [Pseudozobellia sp.]|nr:hypothetical protein [Pseudozobellia sp.]MBG48543.1 hypothetical protein [Pseudozobellia sp.]|tara:strand:- start:548931 stop:549755 length:825 start_codon:yes stop_codon:yes gene_type:complete
MRWLQRIFDFYLDASIHVALSVFALTHITAISLNFSLNNHLPWFLFFGTITCYNFMKYGVEAEKYILVANRYHKNIQFASFLAFAAAIYHFYFLPKELWVALIVFLIFTALYALPVLPHSKKLRSWGGLKIFVVALVWAGTTVILPALTESYINWWDVGIETLRRFLFVFILMVPFEIRDLIYDSPELRTLPQRYGVARTKVLGALANIPLFFLVLFKDHVSVIDVTASGILFLALGMLMFITKRRQKKYFASFWVEGIPIMWWGLFLILQKIF